MQIYLQQAKTALKYYLLNLFQIYTVSQLPTKAPPKFKSVEIQHNSTEKKYITITTLIILLFI